MTGYFTNVSADEALAGTPFPSAARTVTETDLAMFSGLSGDYSPVHSDEVFAQKLGFPSRILHGMLTMSIASGLAEAARPFPSIVSYGYERVRFLKPVVPGQTIHVVQTVESTKEYPKDDTKVVREIRYDVRTENDETVLVCIHLLLCAVSGI